MTPGAKIGPYEVLESIGEGGMGEVYRATDTRLGREVAIKVAKEQFSERFEREARAVAALNHPHISQLYDVGPNYLVMELVEGAPLKGPLPLDKAIDYAGQILDALDAAHKKSITHRDLKPANILVTKQGIKLLDFGLAKQTAPLQQTDVTRAITGQGQILGTLQYMSPEQLQGKDVDARSDLFSFGCVLYEMLSGKQAFEGGSAASVIAMILEREPAPLEVARPLDRVVKRSLAKDPDQRFQTARDLKSALSWALEQPPAAGVSQGRNGKLPWAIAGVLTFALAIALGALWRFTRPVETNQPSVRLDFDLGPDVSLGSSIGPAVVLSPDGNRLVFVSQGSDNIGRLFTRRLDQPKAARLSGTEGAYAPFFSPDGQWVGFFAGGKLKKTRIDGGEPIPLCDAPAGRGASWGEDGAIIAALDSQTALSEVPAEGGRAVFVTKLSLEVGENTHRWPQVLPGGKAVLFNVSTNYANYDEAGIAVLALKDHRKKTVLEHAGMYPRYLPSGHLVYVTKGTLFAVPFDLDRLEVRGPATSLEQVSSNPNIGSAQLDFSRNGTFAYRTGGTEGLRTIQWLDSSGKTAPLWTEPAFYLFTRLSPDGGRLAFMLSQGSSTDLWIYDSQRGSKLRLTNGVVTGYPVWSPDGQFVVFQSTGGMSWVRADGAGKPQPLTQTRSMQLPTSFTSDGKRLVFSELTPETGGEIRTVSVESESGRLRVGEPQLFLKTSTTNVFPTFSPDGRWLAYADSPAGSYEIYVRAFPDNGRQLQISNAGGTLPVWSRNGHELFYRTEDNRIMVANYTVKGESFVADKPRVWFGKQLANIGLGVNFDIAPDGKRFVGLMPAESPEPRETQNHITLMMNFFDEVRRRTSVGK